MFRHLIATISLLSILLSFSIADDSKIDKWRHLAGAFLPQGGLTMPLLALPSYHSLTSL
jgi:hypothetical protein